MQISVKSALLTRYSEFEYCSYSSTRTGETKPHALMVQSKVKPK